MSSILSVEQLSCYDNYIEEEDHLDIIRNIPENFKLIRGQFLLGSLETLHASRCEVKKVTAVKTLQVCYLKAL